MKWLFITAIIVGLSYSMEVGKVESFSGKVDKLEKGQVRPQALTEKNLSLSIGEILRTKSDGNAKVSFIDGNKIEMGPLTKLSILDYEKTKLVNIARGRVIFEVMKLKPGEGFEIRTPTAILGVKGTRFLVDVTPTATFVAVFSGSVQIKPVNNPTLILTATPGTTVTVSTVEVKNASITPSTGSLPQININNPPIPEVTPPCVR